MQLKLSTLGKTAALIAVASILPSLAYAKSGGEKDDKGDQNGKGDIHGKGNGDDKDKDKGGKGGHKPPVVPEANAAWVLLPFFGAVLLFSARQFSRAKA